MIWRLPACLGVLATLSGCHGGLLDSQGPVGANEVTILIDALLVMLAIVVPTILAVIAFAWWFRSSNPRAIYNPGFVYSGQIELVVWSIPVMVILLLGGVSWIGSHELDPALPLESSVATLEVEVVSLDWKWLFVYPEQGIASVNMLVVPAGTPLHFKLTSASVLSAFFVPELGSMIYTMNGMTTQLNLMADRPGLYRGLSSHFNGDGFSGMHFMVSAVSAEQFATWVMQTRQSGPVLDAAGYRTLSKQTLNVAPFTYRDASAGLFRNIVMQTLPPGPGPEKTRLSVISPRIGGDDASR